MSLLKKAALGLIILLPLYALTHKAFAIHKAYAVYSPNCPEKIIVRITGNALININRVELAEGLHSFNVTLDTEKMTYRDLIKKMQENGCYME